MPQQRELPTELRDLGHWVATARKRQAFTQQELARKARLTQPQLSLVEQGKAIPTLPQAIRLAHALKLPLQWLLSGATTPGRDIADLAIELQTLGLADLVVPQARVPGAFRPTEEALALAVSGDQPEPRILEALPALLAWNAWSPTILRSYARTTDRRAGHRLAWLVDIALTIHAGGGFPGGCLRPRELETYLRWWTKRPPRATDSVGRPAANEARLPPLWKRWKITYDATLAVIAARAGELNQLRQREQRADRGRPRHA